MSVCDSITKRLFVHKILGLNILSVFFVVNLLHRNSYRLFLIIIFIEISIALNLQLFSHKISSDTFLFFLDILTLMFIQKRRSCSLLGQFFDLLSCLILFTIWKTIDHLISIIYYSLSIYFLHSETELLPLYRK